MLTKHRAPPPCVEGAVTGLPRPPRSQLTALWSPSGHAPHSIRFKQGLCSQPEGCQQAVKPCSSVLPAPRTCGLGGPHGGQQRLEPCPSHVLTPAPACSFPKLPRRKFHQRVSPITCGRIVSAGRCEAPEGAGDTSVGGWHLGHRTENHIAGLSHWPVFPVRSSHWAVWLEVRVCARISTCVLLGTRVPLVLFCKQVPSPRLH